MNHNQQAHHQSKVPGIPEKNALLERVTPPLFIRAKPAVVYRAEASIRSLGCWWLANRSVEVTP